MQRPIVVDTSILFSALLKRQTRFASILLESENDFYVCEQVIIELFKHKEKITRYSKLSEDEILKLYHAILRRLTLYKEDDIAVENRLSADMLCQAIDENDSRHIALVLELGGLFWTSDEKLKNGLRHQGFDQFFEPEEMRFV